MREFFIIILSRLVATRMRVISFSFGSLVCHDNIVVMIIVRRFNQEVIARVRKGKVGIIPTDTIYGIVGVANSPEAVAKIYRIRKRDSKKPMIILISKISDLKLFGIKLTEEIRKILDGLWPGKVSIILKSTSKKFKYLDRGKKTLAFRLPDNKTLRSFISKTGPLVAPSANPEGLEPAINIQEAKRYFGDKVDFYVDKGSLKSKPSKLVAIRDHEVILIRK